MSEKTFENLAQKPASRMLASRRQAQAAEKSIIPAKPSLSAGKKTINRMRDVGAISPALKALREYDGVLEPSYETKVAFINKVLERFGFSGEQAEIILCQFHREGYNYLAKPPIELDPKVVAGGDNTGMVQIRPGTARSMAQKLGIPELRGISPVRRTVKKKDGTMKTVSSERPLINYLRDHWATTVILGVAYLAEQRDDIRKMSGTLEPMEEMRRILASYNAGPGRFRGAFKKEPHSWLKLMPSITRKYVEELTDSGYRQKRFAAARTRVANVRAKSKKA